jgi:hypothetical protein
LTERRRFTRDRERRSLDDQMRARGFAIDGTVR